MNLKLCNGMKKITVTTTRILTRGKGRGKSLHSKLQSTHHMQLRSKGILTFHSRTSSSGMWATPFRLTWRLRGLTSNSWSRSCKVSPKSNYWTTWMNCSQTCSTSGTPRWNCWWNCNPSASTCCHCHKIHPATVVFPRMKMWVTLPKMWCPCWVWLVHSRVRNSAILRIVARIKLFLR